MVRIRNKLERQVSRHLKIDDYEIDIPKLKDSISETHALYPLVDGLKPFFDAIIQTYDEYEDKNKMATRNLEISSQELNEANHNLESLNSSIKAMLESLGPGLLFFSPEGVCSPVFSKSCLDILEQNPGGALIWDILRIEPGKVEEFKSLLDFAFNNNSALPFEDIFLMAPDRYQHKGGRVIRLDYRPIYNVNSELTSVLVIATDITQETDHRLLIQKKEEYAEKIIRIVQNQNGFIGAVNRLEDFFLNKEFLQYQDPVALSTLKGELHTLKGLAGGFYLQDIVATIHNIEDFINYEKKTIEQSVEYIESRLIEINDQIEEEKSLVKSLLGEDALHQGDAKSFSYQSLYDFYEKIEQKDPILASFYYDQFIAIPIWDQLKVFDQYIQQAASALGKEMYPCKFEGDNFSIPAGTYKSVFEGLVHLARNAVDHGIEPNDIRLQRQKDPIGQITICTKIVTNKNGVEFIELKIADDGQGINVQNLKKKLINALINLDGLSDLEIAQHIFSAQVSSRNSVSTFSGRGIGLSYLYNEVISVNGQIRVDYEVGKGAVFTLILPLERKKTPA